MHAAAWHCTSRNPAVTAGQSTARPIARLFAPSAAADKLILKRLIKSRSFATIIR
jgi:hypothetical protein